VVPIFNFSCKDIVCLYIVLLVYILFKFVNILDFDGLIFNVVFFMLITLLNVVDRFWNIV